MNNSGAVAQYFPLAPDTKCIVVCDNLDLPAGMIRIRSGGSSAGHNGLKSMIASYGTSDFIRIYVGIGRPVGDATVVDHVLGAPTGSERIALGDGIALGSKALVQMLGGMGIQEAMLEFNRKVIGS